jgi:hypothetical protein
MLTRSQDPLDAKGRIEIALTDLADSGTMLRTLVIVLVLAVGIDFFMLNRSTRTLP